MKIRTKIVMCVAVAVVATAAAVAVAVHDASAGGGQVDPYIVRVTLTTGSGGSDSFSFVGRQYSVEATSVAGRHSYTLFTIRGGLDPTTSSIRNFVANRRLATVQVDVLPPLGEKVMGYRLNDASIASIKHVMDDNGFVFEEVGFAFASIDYQGFGAAELHDVNTGR